MTLTEIEARLAAIASEVDADGADLTALEQETNTLTEERSRIQREAETRRSIRERVAGSGGTVIERGEHNMPEGRNFAVDGAEYRSAWLRNIQGHDLDTEERAAVTATAAIPTITLNRIVEKMEQTSVLYRHVTSMNIRGNVTIPVANAVTDASWLPVSSAATDGADTLTSITLGANKLIKTLSIGADVAGMAIDAFETWLTVELARKMDAAVDAAILSGNNTNQPKGITQEIYSTDTTSAPQINLVNVASTGSIGWDQMMDLIKLLPGGYRQNAKIITSRKTLYGEIAKTKASTAGIPLFVMDAEDGFTGKIMGYPVIECDQVADGEVYLADLSRYYFNWAKPVEISRDDSVEFRTGNTVYRAMALADGELVDKCAVVKLKKG